jgi:hypothetical protein
MDMLIKQQYLPLNVESIDVTDDTSQLPMSWLNVVLLLNRLSKLVIRLTFHAAMGPYVTDEKFSALISACKAVLLRNTWNGMDGAFVGVNVGDLVGDFVEGTFEGVAVGLLDGGGIDGLELGRKIGKAVGALDGEGDGLRVGLAVRSGQFTQ